VSDAADLDGASVEELDEATLSLRRWSAEAQIVARSWSLSRRHGLDPCYVERIEAAVRGDNLDVLEGALADFLRAVDEAG
jgi:hypothetical protein